MKLKLKKKSLEKKVNIYEMRAGEIPALSFEEEAERNSYILRAIFDVDIIVKALYSDIDRRLESHQNNILRLFHLEKPL